MADSDKLWDMRNQFFLGNYQGTINEAATLGDLSATEEIERDCFVYRSYIAQGNLPLVLSEIEDSAAQSLLAVRLLAKYLASTDLEKSDVVSEAKEYLANQTSENATTAVVIATILGEHEDHGEALRCVYTVRTLESRAFVVQTYLKMNRPDLAEKEVQSMQQEEDDATLTQLSVAWVDIAMGGEKFQDAFFIFEELSSKYGSTCLLLNGIAVCHMHMQRYSDAEKSLLESLEKNTRDTDTVANLIACMIHLNKSQDIINRYITQLKQIAPGHPRTRDLDNMEASFSRSAAVFIV